MLCLGTLDVSRSVFSVIDKDGINLRHDALLFDLVNDSLNLSVSIVNHG